MRTLGQILTRVPRGDGHKGAPGDQVGGEFFFEEGKVMWCHRMRNATNHSELSKIHEVLGLPSAGVGSNTFATRTT